MAVNSSATWSSTSGYPLFDVRSPKGIIVALAEELNRRATQGAIPTTCQVPASDAPDLRA